MKTNLSKITLSLATLLTLSATTVCADNLLQNGSFENFTVLKAKKNWKKVQLEHWNEPSKINLRGEDATDGDSKIALDSSRVLNLLTQTITTIKDGTYRLSVDAYASKKRLSTAGFEMIVDGEVVGTFRATEDWENYKVSFVGKGGEQTIGFREIASENDNKGVFLDNAELSVKAPVQTIDLAQKFGKAIQGSTPSYARAYHNANMGIDGNVSSYIYTNSGTQSWYQVEIPKGSTVSKIMIQSGVYKPYRLKDAKVYVSNTPYNQTVNGLEEVGTLKGDASEQIIQFDTPKEIRYVIVKGKDKLHIGSLEILGKASQAPIFENTEEQLMTREDTEVGTIVATVNAVDYQGESITYRIIGNVPFVIDAEGNIKVNANLTEATYHFDIEASDGENATTLPIDINISQIDLAQKYGVATQGSAKGYKHYRSPQEAIDGDINTWNHTDGGKWGYNWLQVQLPSPTTLDKVVIQNGNNIIESYADTIKERIGGAKVYLSNTPYKQGDSVDESKLIATLQSTNEPQIIKTNGAKGTFLLIKGAYSETNDKHLHLSRVEAYGALPKAPTFDNSNFNITIDKWQGKSESIFDVNSTDYQGDTINYAIDGKVPFAIDANGALHVTSTLNAGVYNLNVVVSDGTHSQTRVVTVNVTDTPIVKEIYNVKDKTPNLSGYLPNSYSNGDSFTITINGVEYNPTINDDGTWSIDGEDLESLPTGMHDLVLNVDGEHITYANYVDIYGDRYLKKDFNFDMSSFTNQEVNVTNSTMDYPEKGEYFRGSSIALKVENGKAKVINKSYKRYKSVLVKYTDANGKEIFKELTFDKALEPHTVNEVTRFTNDEMMSVVNTAGLLDLELGFGGFSYTGAPEGTKYCTKEILDNDPGLTYCMPLHAGQEDLRYTDTSKVVTEQQDAYDTLMGTFNHFYNSVDAYPAMQAWMKMEPYKGTEPVSLNTGAYVKELHAHNGEDYVSENFYHAVLPNDKIRLTILQNDGGVYGRGNGKSSSLFGIDEHPNHGYISMVDWTMDRDFSLRMYDSVHHEMMHGKGYSHDSGMTYGWSQFVRSYIQYNPNEPYTVHVNPEAIVAKYIFSTKKLDSHTVQVTLQKKEGAIGQDLTLEVLSSSYLVADDITIERRAEDALNQVTISVNPNIKTRLIIRAFGEDSLEVMSKFVTLD